MEDSYYKSRYVPNKDREVVWKEIVRFLKPYLFGKEAVVDLGAGYCDFINNVVANERFAVDMSSDFSKYAEDGVKIIRTEVTDLSRIQTNSVDVVFSSNLLEHLNDMELDKTMKEVKRILKDDGLFISMQPNYRYAYKTYFDDHTHKKVFSHTALQGFLIFHNLNIIKMIPKFLPFSLKSRPSIIPLSSFIVRAYLNSPFRPFAGQMLVIAKK